MALALLPARNPGNGLGERAVRRFSIRPGARYSVSPDAVATVESLRREGRYAVVRIDFASGDQERITYPVADLRNKLRSGRWIPYPGGPADLRNKLRTGRWIAYPGGRGERAVRRVLIRPGARYSVPPDAVATVESLRREGRYVVVRIDFADGLQERITYLMADLRNKLRTGQWIPYPGGRGPSPNRCGATYTRTRLRNPEVDYDSRRGAYRSPPGLASVGARVWTRRSYPGWPTVGTPVDVVDVFRHRLGNRYRLRTPDGRLLWAYPGDVVRRASANPRRRSAHESYSAAGWYAEDAYRTAEAARARAEEIRSQQPGVQAFVHEETEIARGGLRYTIYTKPMPNPRRAGQNPRRVPKYLVVVYDAREVE